MPQSIDHVVIAVRDLARATSDYERLGFTVMPGGYHTGGATHNALISFADGSYIELIAFTEPDRPQAHKWWAKFALGEGTVDFAVLSDDLIAEAERLRAAGIAVDGPIDGGRKRPDGQRIAWKSLTIASDDGPLPFVIEDVTPRELRVPPGDATRHVLGVTGVAGVTVLVPDLERALALYETFLRSRGEEIDLADGSVARARRFQLGPHWIELAEPVSDANHLHEAIASRGIAPFRLVLVVPGEDRIALPLAETHGARIELV